MNLYDLQQQVAQWTAHNFPNKLPHQPLLGVQEEVGELAHAHLKMEQKIRGSEQEHQTAKIDAVADIVIYLADYCERNGISMGRAVQDTWEKVSLRNWIDNPKDGSQPLSA